MTLRQSAYIESMMSEHAPEGVPSKNQRTTVPCDDSLPRAVCDALVNQDEVDPVLLKRYQSLVGALLYCAINTRPDVAYSVGYLGRAMSRPTPDLLELAKRVLRVCWGLAGIRGR